MADRLTEIRKRKESYFESLFYNGTAREDISYLLTLLDAAERVVEAARPFGVTNGPTTHIIGDGLDKALAAYDQAKQNSGGKG